jgi:hypothetical protein
MRHGNYLGQRISAAPRNGTPVLLLLRPSPGGLFQDRFIVAAWQDGHWLALAGVGRIACDTSGEFVEYEDDEVEQFFALPQEARR